MKDKPVSQEKKQARKESPNAFEEAGTEEQLTIVQEFWLFIVENKAWWMIPILLTLAIVGLLVALGATGAAPFIYTLF